MSHSASDDTVAALATLTERVKPLVACACQGEIIWPDGAQDWLEGPGPDLTEPTRWTVRDGRCWGHLALWDSCHTGHAGCVRPPREEDYTPYERGTAFGVPVGVVTMGTDHASLASDLSASDVQRHYADTGAVAAYVRAEADDHGIRLWGLVAPDLTEGDVVRLTACGVSGDWRDVARDGRLRLLAVLAVPVPGFPVAASASTEGPSALTGGWRVTR